MKKTILFLFIISLCGGCTSTLNLPVLKPADVMLPQDIQKFVLANRTKPSKKNKAWNIAEGVLTGEGLFADREGADQCLHGLMSIMSKTPRYTITIASNEFLGTGTEMFAPPLPWNEVEKICQANNAEALIVLEAFDSDSRMTFDSQPVKVKNPEGIMDTVIEHYAHARMEVKTGWRIYFPKDKRIIDEHRSSDFLQFDGKGATPELATANLPPKREAIKKTGFHSGNQYGFRISPQWIYVQRQFYTKGNDNMKIAGKKARQINDWNSAMEIWKKEALNSDTKIAWHASHNMAVACEREGNLELALEWAKKSYNISHKSVSAQYINTLNFRMEERKRLEEQMKGKQ